GICTLLDLVSFGLPFRHRCRQILPDETEVIHDRTDCTALDLRSAKEDEDARKLDHLQSLIRRRNAAQRGPEFLLRGDIADIKMNVSSADSRTVRWRELRDSGHRESHSQKESKRGRCFHWGHCTSKHEQKKSH